MTDGQYRALVAYLRVWPNINPEFGLDQAISDIGIEESRDAVIDALTAAGWRIRDDNGRAFFIEMDDRLWAILAEAMRANVPVSAENFEDCIALADAGWVEFLNVGRDDMSIGITHAGGCMHRWHAPAKRAD